MVIVDLWARLHDIFDAEDSTETEITIWKLSPAAMQVVFHYLLNNSREIQTVFYTILSRRRVMVGSLEKAVSKLARRELAGGFAVEVRVCGLILPMMSVFCDGAGRISLGYQAGRHWNPVGLIALFELFRMIKAVDDNAIIRLSEEHFDQRWQMRFAATLRDYLNETLS